MQSGPGTNVAPELRTLKTSKARRASVCLQANHLAQLLCSPAGCRNSPPAAPPRNAGAGTEAERECLEGLAPEARLPAPPPATWPTLTEMPRPATKVTQPFTPCSSPTFGRRLEMLDGTILQREIPAPIRQLPSARSRHDDAAHPSNDNKALPSALVWSLDAVLGPSTSSFCACQSQLQQRLQGVFAAPPLAILPLGDARSMVRGHAR
mmetsp:Transcript_23335/g.65922  ORF Transcript_23335/g.65922 Transcript_23335/m.65922 type:complete len:208 (+) Transcript_23335:67-690(+)